MCALQHDSADVGVQVQEQLERRALAAGAAGLGRAVNNLTGSAAWKWLLHGALRLCRTAVHALWPSLRALVQAPQPCPASLVLATACLCMTEVQ